MNPDSEHWDELQRLFELADAVAPEDRMRVLEAECSDEGLLRRVMALIEASSPAAGSEPVEKRERIGPYAMLSLLGSGGMGSVYRAERVMGSTVQRVALKVLAPHAAGPSFVDRFAREQQILGALDHPGITRMLDAGVSESGRPYLVMEFVEGSHLTGYCDAGRLDERARLNLFLKICEAVEYAHRRLVVHLDLKPSNILVTAEGVVKLLDFGTAKLLQPDGTFTATVMATPAYASPEQLRHEPPTTASDVYSLGVILHELLTGQRPKGGTMTMPPGDAATIVQKCLGEDPADRYAAVNVLADDVARYLGNRPILARPQSMTYRFWKLVRRHPVNFSMAALLLLGLGFAAAFSAWQAKMAQRQVELLKQMVEQEFATVSSHGAWFYSSIEPAKLDRLRTTVESLDQSQLTPKLHYILGQCYSSLGQTFWSPYFPSRLDVKQSMRAYRQALAHYQLALGGGDSGFRSGALAGLSEAAMQLADEEAETGAGLAAYGAVFEPTLAVLHEQPPNPSSLGDVGGNYDMLSDRLGKKTLWTRLEELRDAPPGLRKLTGLRLSRATDLAAVVAYKRANELGQAIPDWPGFPLVDVQLGRLLAESGSPAEGREVLQRALAIFEAAGKRSDPDAAIWASRAAGAHGQLGRIAEAEKNYPAALEHFAAGRRLLEGLLEKRKQPFYLDRVAVARLHVARILMRVGRSREALPLAQSAARLFREEARDERTPGERLELAAYYLITLEPREARDAPEALTAAELAVKRSARAMPSYLTTLAVAQFMTGRASEAEATSAEALAIYRKALPAWRVLFEDPLFVDARSAYAASLRELAQ